jgi:hypothetical protein
VHLQLCVRLLPSVAFAGFLTPHQCTRRMAHKRKLTQTHLEITKNGPSITKTEATHPPEKKRAPREQICKLMQTHLEVTKSALWITEVESTHPPHKKSPRDPNYGDELHQIFAFIRPTEEFTVAMVHKDWYDLFCARRDQRGQTQWRTPLSSFGASRALVDFAFSAHVIPRRENLLLAVAKAGTSPFFREFIERPVIAKLATDHTLRRRVMIAAVEGGNMRIVKYLLDHKFPYSTGAIEAAARRRDRSMLIPHITQNADYMTAALRTMCAYGETRDIEWLVGMGAEISSLDYNSAAAHGRADIYRWLRAYDVRPIPLLSDDYYYAIRSGSLELVTYLETLNGEHAAPVAWHLASALACRQLNIVDHFIARGVHATTHVLCCAARISLDIFRRLVKEGEGILADVAVVAAHESNLGIVRFVWEHNISIVRDLQANNLGYAHLCTTGVSRVAVKNNNTDILDFIAENPLYPRSLAVCGEYAKKNDLQRLQWAIAHDFPFNEDCIILAARTGAIDTLKYLIERSESHSWWYVIGAKEKFTQLCNRVYSAAASRNQLLAMKVLDEYDMKPTDDILVYLGGVSQPVLRHLMDMNLRVPQTCLREFLLNVSYKNLLLWHSYQKEHFSDKLLLSFLMDRRSRIPTAGEVLSFLLDHSCPSSALFSAQPFSAQKRTMIEKAIARMRERNGGQQCAHCLSDV